MFTCLRLSRILPIIDGSKARKQGRRTDDVNNILALERGERTRTVQENRHRSSRFATRFPMSLMYVLLSSMYILSTLLLPVIAFASVIFVAFCVVIYPTP